MQVTLTPTTPAEMRLVADFISLLADNQPELEIAQPEVQQAEPAKKSRAKKTDPVVTTAAPEPEATAPATPDVGNESATTASTPAESGSPETATKTYSVDDLRKLFGELAQADKRDAAVKLVRGYGFNGIAAITPDKQDEIGGKLEAMLHG